MDLKRWTKLERRDIAMTRLKLDPTKTNEGVRVRSQQSSEPIFDRDTETQELCFGCTTQQVQTGLAVRARIIVRPGVARYIQTHWMGRNFTAGRAILPGSAPPSAKARP